MAYIQMKTCKLRAYFDRKHIVRGAVRLKHALYKKYSLYECLKKIYAWWGNEIETGARAKRVIFGLMSAYFLSVLLILLLAMTIFSLLSLDHVLRKFTITRIVDIWYLLPYFWHLLVDAWEGITGIDCFSRLYLLIIPFDMLALVALPFFVYYPVIWFSLYPNRRNCFAMVIIVLFWRIVIF